MKYNKVLVLLGVLAGIQSAQASLLANGSFELPIGTTYASLPGASTTITGWTTGLSGIEWFNVSGSYPILGAAADGVMAVDLANFTFVTGGQIEQTFATSSGQAYTLDFSLGTSNAFSRLGTAHVDVDVAGVSAGYGITNVASAIAWSTQTLTFTATGSSTTLQFKNTEDPYTHFAFIDNVQVTPVVPVPAAVWLLGSGLLALGALRKQQAAIGR